MLRFPLDIPATAFCDRGKNQTSYITFDKKDKGKKWNFFLLPHDRLASLVGVVELLIPVGQEDVALSYNVTDHFGVVKTMQPRLAAGCVHVGVGSKEWHERTGLVPTHQQFSAWSVKEAANISYKRGSGIIKSLDLPPLKLVACSEFAQAKIRILRKNRNYQHFQIYRVYFLLDRQQI